MTTASTRLSVDAFRHHPDDGLGPRLADHQPASFAKPALAGADRRLNGLGLQRLAAIDPNAAQDLGIGREDPADLAQRAVARHDHRQDLQRGDQAIAGPRIVGQDDVAGLLAADVAAAVEHLLQHIAVADICPEQCQAQVTQVVFQPQVRHHSRNDAAAGEAIVFMPIAGHQAHQLVTVEQRARLVADEYAVGVAVEGNAEVRALLDDPGSASPGCAARRILC